MATTPKYFMYYPDNYRWSAAYVNMLGRGHYGGSDISELHKIGRLLEGHVGDDAAWYDAFVQVADEVSGHAERFRASNHPVSAAPFYLRASHYYQMGERFRTPKDELALATYQRSIDCFHKFVEQTDLNIEIVEVPFEGKSMPGYFVHAQNTKSERAPCVVFFDGLDVTKEILFVMGTPELIKRGISVLLMDGPGTGEAIRFRNMVLRHDYDRAGSACIDYLETRPDVDAKKIGVVAVSLGGYYAPRCASLEPRFAACIAWGAIWDYQAVWKRRIEAQFNASMSVPGHHIMWILGADSLDDALQRLEGFKLDGVVQQMRCPFLLCHGEDDEQIPLEDAQALFDACGSPDKTFRIFTSEEGGAQHCQRDYLPLGCATMWNWFEDKLVRN
jgi:dienelactone hydrolase